MPKDESVQRTPNEGYAIPIPTRGEVEDALARVVQPEKKPSRRGKRGPKKK